MRYIEISKAKYVKRQLRQNLEFFPTYFFLSLLQTYLINLRKNLTSPAEDGT